MGLRQRSPVLVDEYQIAEDLAVINGAEILEAGRVVSSEHRRRHLIAVLRRYAGDGILDVYLPILSGHVAASE